MEQGIGLRVLIAEDDDLSFAVLMAILRRAESRTFCSRVVCGREVCETYLSSPQMFDLILMDVEMPDMSGIQAAGYIRQKEQEHQLKPIMIVALTAHEEDEVSMDAFKSKIDIVLTKPIKLPDLDSVLTHAETYRNRSEIISQSKTASAGEPSLLSAVNRVRQHLVLDLLRIVSEIPIALQIHCSSSIRHIANSIKSVGAHLSNSQITELGRAIQDAALESNWNLVKQYSESLLALIGDLDPAHSSAGSGGTGGSYAYGSGPYSNSSGLGERSAPSPSPPQTPRRRDSAHSAFSAGALGIAGGVPLLQGASSLQMAPGLLSVPAGILAADPVSGIGMGAHGGGGGDASVLLSVPYMPQSDLWENSPTSHMSNALRLAAADSVVFELKKRGMREIRSSIDRINVDLVQGDFASISRIGHILKGVGGHLNQMAVFDIGKALHAAGLERNEDRIRDLLRELTRFVETAEPPDPFSSSLQSALAALSTGDSPVASPRDENHSPGGRPKRARPGFGSVSPSHQQQMVMHREDDSEFHELAELSLAQISIVIDTGKWEEAVAAAERLQFAAQQTGRLQLAGLCARVLAVCAQRSLQMLSGILRELQVAIEGTQTPMSFP